MSHFIQDPPQLADAWAENRVLREAVAWLTGDELFDRAEPLLAEMGARSVAPEVLALAMQAEREPPVHVPYSAWGRRVDEIRVSPAYLELGRLGVEAGVTALPYEDDPFGDRARIVWGALVTLWGPSSALYSCPVAMTDAAARTLLLHGDVDDFEVVQRLTTRDYASAWTSGQWMTETTGGSDVSRTETVARRDGNGWRLHGTKWFTSATTSEMALTLARPEGGDAGLALFRIHRLEDGEANNIVVRRLKDKLGTRSLPTAELELQGALAHPVGDPLDGGGVRRISTMLNITRIHNSIGATGSLARGLGWARAYARVRSVFGRPLQDQPAHRATLTDLAVDHVASLALTLRSCELMGRAEHGNATADEALVLRALTPVTKLATARWAVAGAAEAMEAVGGVGYCEDSGLPALVRNTHVMPIWEGTTNVLSLDLLRAARKGAVDALIEDGVRIASRLADDGEVGQAAATAAAALGDVGTRLASLAAEPDRAEASARSIAMTVASSYACLRLCAQASWAAKRGAGRTAALARRMAARGLTAPLPPEDLSPGMDAEAPASRRG